MKIKNMIQKTGWIRRVLILAKNIIQKSIRFRPPALRGFELGDAVCCVSPQGAVWIAFDELSKRRLTAFLVLRLDLRPAKSVVRQINLVKIGIVLH
jgi:hypothetical protein